MPARGLRNRSDLAFAIGAATLVAIVEEQLHDTLFKETFSSPDHVKGRAIISRPDRKS